MKAAINNFFSFPELINEVSARFVAFGVFIMSTITLVLINLEHWVSMIFVLFLLYGFFARVIAGPKISPLALLVTKVIVPNLNFKEKIVPGPPKRFAQSIGLTMASAILISLILGVAKLASVLLIILMIFAFLESVFAYCAGCKIFKLLMISGIIPEQVCAKCANYQI